MNLRGVCQDHTTILLNVLFDSNVGRDRRSGKFYYFLIISDEYKHVIDDPSARCKFNSSSLTRPWVRRILIILFRSSVLANPISVEVEPIATFRLKPVRETKASFCFDDITIQVENSSDAVHPEILPLSTSRIFLIYRLMLST
jgi:hypothetical protein